MKKIEKHLSFYLIILLSFSYFFLFVKHQIGNDSTISEWFINYEGGFTKRGIIGQIAVELSRQFESNLRWVIFLLQSLAYTIYFLLLYSLLKNLRYERIIILSIFTPIFILYPIAEIEVLARKEIIVFSLFIIYLFIPRSNNFKLLSFIIFSILAMLVWEPIIFFYPLILIYLIIDNKIKKFDTNFFKIILSFVPSLVIAFIFIFNPLTEDEHALMAFILKSEFGQSCYMSCGLLIGKSTIIEQFEGNYGRYSLEVFVRYFLIIFIGFFPLVTLIKNSSLKSRGLLFFNFFNKPVSLFYISLAPVILLFAMGLDWGRWVNITYVILALIYFKLLLDKHFILNYENLKKGLLYKIRGKTFVFFFIMFSFGWNPKTVITGDVASFPGYRVPYKVFKILSN
ncbi:hypothetical protein N9S67_01695 [Candidatus Pelagibacter sp.]|nr:hypothetical protein [Candidatus Pelagibacter sp.]